MFSHNGFLSPGLVVTRAAVGEFDQFFLIVPGGFDVTVQTPAHVHHLRIFVDAHLAHIAVAVFTVLPRGDMRAMVELNEIRDDGNGNPFERLTAEDGVLKRGKQCAVAGLYDLIVARPALRL